MRIYVAGPMTGLEAGNFPAFDAARDQLQAIGWEVVSPADITRAFWRREYGTEFDPNDDSEAIWAGGHLYERFMREDFRAIVECDAIALLPGWQRSSGVARELVVARALGLVEYELSGGELGDVLQETPLQEAQRLVHGDRGAAYGHPLDDYQRTGTMWGAVLHDWAKEAAESPAPIAVPAHLATLCMVCVKVSREVNREGRDNMVDAAGYAECTRMIREESSRRVGAR